MGNGDPLRHGRERPPESPRNVGRRPPGNRPQDQSRSDTTSSSARKRRKSRLITKISGISSTIPERTQEQSRCGPFAGGSDLRLRGRHTPPSHHAVDLFPTDCIRHLQAPVYLPARLLPGSAAPGDAPGRRAPRPLCSRQRPRSRAPRSAREPNPAVRVGICVRIPPDVALQLLPPPLPVVHWCVQMLWARVPEAPLHEDHGPPPHERQVRTSAAHARKWQVNAIAEAQPVHCPSQGHLRTRTAPPP